MTDVSISDFQLPGDDPAGGITLAVVTQFTNPSAFGVEIGSLVVDLFYGDLYLGFVSIAFFLVEAITDIYRCALQTCIDNCADQFDGRSQLDSSHWTPDRSF